MKNNNDGDRRDSSHTYVNHRLADTTHIMFFMSDRQFAVVRHEDVELLLMDLQVSRAERLDMIQIFDEEIGDTE